MRAATGTASAAARPSRTSAWRRCPSPATASTVSGPSKKKSARPRGRAAPSPTAVSVRSGVFVALAFGAAVAYLASLNATRVRVALSSDLAWDVPLVALVVGTFVAGAALAFVFGLARDLRRSYVDYQRTRDVRRAESVTEIYHRGVDAQLSGRPEAATQAYGELLKRFPDHAQAHARLGEMALERGDAHGALVHHLDALRTDDRPELVLAAAEDYRRTARPDDAAAMLERLLVQAPEHLTALRALRDLSAQRGDWTRALQAQERIAAAAGPAERAQEQSWLAGIHYELGRSLLGQGQI